MEYTEETLKKILQCGTLGYPLSKILNILDIENEQQFELDFYNKSCILYQTYKKGMDKADFIIDSKLFEIAKGGDLKALEKYESRKNIQINKSNLENKSRIIDEITIVPYINSDHSDLIHFNNNGLSIITDFASKLFMPKDIAINLDIDFYQLKLAMLDEESQIYKAFQSGIMKQENNLNDMLLSSEIESEEYDRRKELLNDYRIKAQIQLSI